MEYLYKLPGFSMVRDWACSECLKLIKYDDESTRYLNIGPVTKAMNMLIRWMDDPKGDAVNRYGKGSRVGSMGL